MGVEYAALRYGSPRYSPENSNSKLFYPSPGSVPITTIVLYGDSNNWFAAWAFWQLKIYGHQDVRILNGGRKKWIAEGRELSHAGLRILQSDYKAKDPDQSLRAYLPQVQQAVSSGSGVARGCAQPAGVYGRNSGTPWTARNVPARRTYSRSP